MSSDNNTPVVRVTDSGELAQLARRWLGIGAIALDTEFERRTTYYPKLALVQIFDGDSIYLIDPLAVECPPELRQLLSDPATVKILHAGKEDVEVLGYAWQAQLQNLFDTQLAYAFSGGENSLGYAALAQKLCDAKVAKAATQSDWMARPLSETQLEYAAEDVLYLLPIYRQLNAKLGAMPEQLAFFQSECRELIASALRQPDLDQDYRQAGDAWRLDPGQLALFKQLYRWREETAIGDNRTRNHILRDPQLVQIAIRQPRRRRELQLIENIHPRSLRIYSQAILSIIENFNPAEQSLPQPVANPRDLLGLKQLNASFYQCVTEQAKKHQLATAILASKRLVKKVATAYLSGEAMPEPWLGWRGELLRPHFDHIFSQFNPTK